MAITTVKAHKLTKAQKALYDQLPCSCAEYYAPAKKLVELGLAKFDKKYLGSRLIKVKN